MKFPNPFRHPTAREIAMTELEGAEHQLLAAQTGKEFADSQITYNQQRVARLRKYIHDVSEPVVRKETKVIA